MARRSWRDTEVQVLQSTIDPAIYVPFDEGDLKDDWALAAGRNNAVRKWVIEKLGLNDETARWKKFEDEGGEGYYLQRCD
jgi:hypothetical protein